MTILIRRSLVTGTLAVVLVANIAAQQPKRFRERKLAIAEKRLALAATQERFKNYEADFSAFAKNDGGCSEYWIPVGLSQVAGSVGECMLAVQSLLEIYGDLECRPDRERAWLAIKHTLDYYATQIDNYVNQVNTSLSNQIMPAVAISGTRMKEELRELKAFLQSVRPS